MTTALSSVRDFRRSYSRPPLDECEVPANPLTLFETWFEEATAAGLAEPNAMSLATSASDGRVSCRTVLLKGCDSRGFVFFTNYDSRKGRQLAENPEAALLFPWVALERQVEVSGSVERLSEQESTAYFESRPAGSRLGAWVSHQSQPIPNRAVLLERLADLEKRFCDGGIPKPPFWGGFRVLPRTIEFWQGGDHRLHDRIIYVREGDGWRIGRLSP